ncbi:MAG: tRNA (pseudouridine(54)-N(1))-methyltransferase TrmY [Myxococcota bacterium]|jgi:tRNA (pseudouridine54-N1)-methyltransferase|nr:tRNA (pseudouridine(54)-N(1))-methyltransferase TrmY [Myxococcota bacterium]
MRRFVILGRTAKASAQFSLDDLPSTSGRLDVLLRCVRAALLTSHGLRPEVLIYLALQGGPETPRVIRIGGAGLQFVRPDERSLALLVQKALGRHAAGAPRFIQQKPGLSVAEGGLERVLEDLGPARAYVLEEGAADIRGASLEGDDLAFFIGDHLGFDEATRAALARIGAEPISVGPLSLHSDDVVSLVSNELDRRSSQ